MDKWRKQIWHKSFLQKYLYTCAILKHYGDVEKIFTNKLSTLIFNFIFLSQHVSILRQGPLIQLKVNVNV
jgi:hypothetical protein